MTRPRIRKTPAGIARSVAAASAARVLVAAQRRAAMLTLVEERVPPVEAGMRAGWSETRARQVWFDIRDELAGLVETGHTPLYAAVLMGMSARAGAIVWETIERDTDLTVERPAGRRRR